MSTKPRQTPNTNAEALAAWARHWPFTRASTALQRRVAQAMRAKQSDAPPAPF